MIQVSTAFKLCPFLFALGCMCFAQPVNWMGPYEPCRNSAELKGTGHLHIGVRYDVSDPVVIQQFHEAFEFWSKVLDADFYDEQSTACAVAIVEGTNTLLGDLVVARAQLPDRSNFEGWIAVERTAGPYLPFGDAIATWIHEIGHLLGLKHSSSPASLMYFIDVDSASRLDSADLRALSRLHTLRGGMRAANAVGVAWAFNDHTNTGSP